MSKVPNQEEIWAISDIEGLQVHLPELDPSRYYDRREHSALQTAIVAWPTLAQLMGLGESRSF
jgi:hypothetical protein